MRRRKLFSKGAGFSLIEVVLATAIFAGSVVAIIGLLGPVTKGVEDVMDSETAARLASTINSELDRLGFDWTAANVPDPGLTPLVLVASGNGSRVRVENFGAPPPADVDLDQAEMPGIGERDRFFRIEVQKMPPPLNFVDGVSGSVAIRAAVSWPYRVPAGPRSSTPKARFSDGGDPFIETPARERRTTLCFFAVRP